jgi:hypothetical protein
LRAATLTIALAKDEPNAVVSLVVLLGRRDHSSSSLELAGWMRIEQRGVRCAQDADERRNGADGTGAAIGTQGRDAAARGRGLPPRAGRSTHQSDSSR